MTDDLDREPCLYYLECTYDVHSMITVALQALVPEE